MMVTQGARNGKTHARTARDSVVNSSGLLQIEFLRITADLVKNMIDADQSEVRAMQQELALIKEGSLCIRKREGKVHFNCYDWATRKTTSLRNNTAQIYELARRMFLENRIKAIEANSKRLSAVLENAECARHEILLRKKLDKYATAGLDLSRILFTKEQNEWIDEPYTPNPYHPEDLIHPTTGGFMMRSKSEADIGSRLELIGLPYRFDDLINIYNERTGERPFRDNYFADFKVPNLSGGITVHEHFGAFHMERYPDNALKRLNDYRTFTVRELPSRIVQPEEFTWSLEADLRDERLFQHIIKRMLLPGSL